MTHKSEEMANFAEEHGWKTHVETNLQEFEETGDVDDIVWMLYAIRETDNKKEVMKVIWQGELQTNAFYKYGDYELRPARKAPVLKLLEGQPDPRKFKKEEPSEQKSLTVEDKLIGRNVPWEGNDAPAFDILIGVLDKTITWVTPTFKEEQSAFCSKQSNLRKGHFKVKTTKAGKRVLEWVADGRFCACYIENIIDVT